MSGMTRNNYDTCLDCFSLPSRCLSVSVSNITEQWMSRFSLNFQDKLAVFNPFDTGSVFQLFVSVFVSNSTE